jgi:hypothetical protein
MARVEIPAPGDLIMDDDGNVQVGVAVSLKLAGAGTDVTHYSALVGGTSATGGLVTSSTGTIVDGSGNRRYVTSGQSLDLTISGITHQIEPVSAADVAELATAVALRPLKTSLAYNARDYSAVGAGLVNETVYLQAAIEAAAGGVLEIPKGTYNITSATSTVTTTSGSPNLTSVLTTTGWVNGEPIHGPGIPIGTTIVSGAGTGTMVMSQNATASATILAKTCLLVRPNTTVICHKDVQFVVTGTGYGAVQFWTPSARTPAGAVLLGVNGVEGAETITVAYASATGFAAADMVQIRDSTVLGGETNHVESNIIESVTRLSGSTATTTSGSPNLTLVSPTTGWVNGMLVEGAGIPANTSIVSGAGTATMVMSQNAGASAAGVAITGTILNLKYPLNFPYQISPGAAITKVTAAENVHWHGGRFDMTGVPSGGGGADRQTFYIEWGLNCSVEDVTGYNFGNKVVDMYGCINSHQRRLVGYSPTAVGPGEGYVARLSYSRDCSIKQVWGRSVRHTADIAGGSDCLIDTVFATGGIVSNQVAAFLHGLESKRCRVINVFASNVETAFAAGNGTFGADYDFTADGISGYRTDIGVFISYGCTGFSVKAKLKQTTIRACGVDNCANGYVEIDTDGIVTNPSNYGAITLAGTNSDITVKPKIRNPLYKGMTITHPGRAVTGVAATDIFTSAAHGFVSGQQVSFSGLTGGAGITAGTLYFVIAANLTTNTFQVSATLGGAAVNFTTDLTVGTVTAKPGKITVLDADIDMGTVANPAIDCSGLAAGGSIVVKRGIINMNSATPDAISCVGYADYIEVEGVEFAGAMLRCVKVSGLPKKVRIRRNNFVSSTTSAVAVRIEDVGDAAVADVLGVTDNDFNLSAGSTTAIQLTTAIASLNGNVADIHGNRYGTVTTKITNTAAATLRGLVDVLTGTVAWDPASLIVGASERKSVTVTGAAVGDPAFGGLSSIAATGWDITAAVIAANTVELKITNNTAATVDLASGTARATVVKHS